MKKISVILFAITLALSASAQKVVVGVGHVGGVYYHPYYYRPYYYGPSYGFGLGFNYGYGYPYYRRPYYGRETRLDKEIIDIQNDYADRISSARADDKLTGRERRHEIRALRHERDAAVDDAKKNYYKQPYRSYNNSNQNNNNSNDNYN